MRNLYNNQAYPLAHSADEALAALRSDETKATSIRKPDWQEQAKIIAQGLTITDNPELAARFNAPKDTDGKKMTGEIGYLRPFTYADIKKEAGENGIDINDETIILLEAHLSEIRAALIEIQTQLLGHDNFETTGRLLLAPKGAIGRAPIMHVDDVYLTLHKTFAGATLRIHTEEGIPFNDTVWDMLNRRKTTKRETENDDSQTQRLMKATEDYNDEFRNTNTTDVIIMNGQKDRDLSDSAQRNQVCVHSSSQMIRVQGQMAVSYFTRPLQTHAL